MGRIRIALVTTIAVAAAVPASAAAHGELLSSAPLTGPAVLTGAAENRYVTYATDGIGGKPVAVSGTIAIPKGTPPAGGWPVVSWAHGTTGIADQCAPSVTGSGPVTFLNRLLDAGYAVVRTDYEGLGTPGDHPYLNGPSEGRSVLDIVRAARAAVPGLSKRVLLAGHSQGGHAALWAAAIGPSWTPELKIRGTVAFAPASFLGLQAWPARSCAARTSPRPG